MHSTIGAAARAQLERGIDNLSDPATELRERVHEARKTCKKLRALLHLLRQYDAELFQRENAWLQDAAHGFADAREADAMMACHDLLARDHAIDCEQPQFAFVRERLEARTQHALSASAAMRGQLAGFVRSLRSAVRRAEQWGAGLDTTDSVLAFGDGYRRARKAMRRARCKPSLERMHEWRKRAKVFGYQTRLVEELQTALDKSRLAALDRLGELLGEDHDLGLYQQTLAENPREFGRSGVLVLVLAQRRQTRLRGLITAAGEEVFGERSGDLADRLLCAPSQGVCG